MDTKPTEKVTKEDRIKGVIEALRQYSEKPPKPKYKPWMKRKGK
jgi:hypothetical protein